MTDAEALLFTDNNGNPVDLGDVVLDGLDGIYRDRVPGIVRLLRSGTPAERLYAAVALLSWGDRSGYEQLSQWTQDPQSVPWHGAPVATSRMSTSDGAWEMLADALQNSRHLSDQKSLRPQRSQAARDLLRLADRVDYDRTLTMALSGDPHLSADTDEELLSAIDRALERLAAGDMPGFDLATQTAGLLAPLARVDDAAAASYAARLIELQPGHRRMLRELVDAMSGATGPDSLAVLHTLSGLGDPLVRSEAEQALRRREAA